MKGLKIAAILMALAIIPAVVAAVGCARNVGEDIAPPARDEPVEAAQRDLYLAVACGVAGPYGEIKERFEQAHPEVTLHQEIGNIVTMAERLRDGRASADMFMSVGSVALGELHEEGLLLEPPMDFAEDRLVVLVPEGNPKDIEELEDLADDGVETVAVAASKSTPGHFAEMALRRAGLWEPLQDRLVRPDKPAMLKGFVSEGKADAAVMLLTCATKEAEMGEEPAEGVPGTEIALEVPHKYYDRLVCQIGILRNASDPELAREFAEFVTTDEPQRILSRWDFAPCERAGEGDASAET
ncbi:MAG: molybdate ABC transporter substrate-binding protein [Armatimonadota bacterium]|nr:molybdate ABC transporter substrate-binding protein [Armatimonadota bacterium]